MNHKLTFPTLILTLGALAPLACSSSKDPAPESGDGDGDGDGSGGTTVVENTGGTDMGSGGTTGASGGNSSNLGGETGSGGETSMGGEPNMGGETSTGGSDGSGGTTVVVPGKPDLTFGLDDVESYTLLDTPEDSGWSRWDPVAQISDGQAQSGTKSVGFFDTTGTGDETPEAPEIRRSFEGASEGVFQGSIYIVPHSVDARAAVFTVFSDSTSSAFRLADFRFDADGSVRWRDSAAGSWVALDGVTFSANSWVDIEIAWNAEAGTNGQVWLTVGETEVDPIELYADALPQNFTIKLGDTGGKDDTAAMYLDDFGLGLAP